MKHRLFCGFVAIAFAVVLAAPTGAQLSPYAQDFEGLDQADPAALDLDGWLVFANVFSGANGNYLYGYGPFPAPNPGGGFSAIDAGQGGPDQGDQQLAVYSDYNNGDHFFGNVIEANVFQEQFVGAGDVGSVWDFTFDARRGNINDPNEPTCTTSPSGAPLPGCTSTALAFIKTLDPNAGFALTNFFILDTTDLPDAWGTYTLSIEIDASLPGQILQIGFANNATFYQPSANIYDNINFAENVCNQLPTVIINACDSGVANQDLDTCTMNDAITACGQGARNHGQFVSCVAHLTNDWRALGLISGADKGQILSCTAQDREAIFYQIRSTVDTDSSGPVDPFMTVGGTRSGSARRSRGDR